MHWVLIMSDCRNLLHECVTGLIGQFALVIHSTRKLQVSARLGTRRCLAIQTNFNTNRKNKTSQGARITTSRPRRPQVTWQKPKYSKVHVHIT